MDILRGELTDVENFLELIEHALSKLVEVKLLLYITFSLIFDSCVITS